MKVNLINPEVESNWSRYAEDYQNHGTVFIQDFLSEEVAEAIYQCMDYAIPWFLNAHDGKHDHVIEAGQYKKMSLKERFLSCPKKPKNPLKFSYAYEKFFMRGAQGVDSSHPLHMMAVIYQALNSPQYLKLIRQITGIPEGNQISAAASRYSSGHYLTAHDDSCSSYDYRYAAHVLGFTKHWKKDWGGLFTFCDERGKAIKQRTPSFNTLCMFKVPRWHCVSRVQPHVKASRYSIYGWYLRATAKGELAGQ